MIQNNKRKHVLETYFSLFHILLITHMVYFHKIDYLAPLLILFEIEKYRPLFDRATPFWEDGVAF